MALQEEIGPMRLFVDCDDTLILWQRVDGVRADGIYFETPYLINRRLVDGILKFREGDPRALIVVWSGGGKEYAHMWARRLGLSDITVPLDKSRDGFDLIVAGDVVVDDEDLGGRRTHRPNEWPEGV
jgi:hypothetical protein